MAVHAKVSWVIAMLGCHMASLGESTCLPDAVEAGRHKNITIDGVSMPLGLYGCEWKTALLMTEVYKTLVEDVLGYNTITPGNGYASSDGILAVGNCKQEKVVECSPEPARSHVALEVWGYEHYNTLLHGVVEILEEKGKAGPELVGSVGFPGAEASFVLGHSSKPADQAGLALEFYKSYNGSLYNASKFFSKVSDIPTSDMLPCQNFSAYEDTENLQKYVKWSGDSDGVEWKDSNISQMKCWDNVWWLSPACRKNRDACIPMITGGKGWGWWVLMAQTGTFDVPVAFGVAASWSLYLSLPMDYKTLLYWWWPDVSFISSNPQKIIYPEYNELEWAVGDKRTSPKDISIDKIVTGQLSRVARQAYDLLKQVSFPAVAITNMMKEQQDAGETDKETACRWLKANKETWGKWIPIDTACIAGQGLVDAGGRFVTERDPRGRCSWCKPGMKSSSIRDDVGNTYICTPCAKGLHQPMPGQEKCDACASGFYQPDLGKASCAPCPLGRFRPADATNSVECQTCTEGMTTNAPGATSIASCGCKEGSFYPADGGTSCVACLPGMHCPFASNATILPKVVAGTFKDTEEEEETYPKVKKGFFSKKEDPLVTYRCVPENACAGGNPGECEGKRVGFMCAKCPENYVTNMELEEDVTADGCTECKISMELYLIVGIVVGLGVITAQLVLAKTSPLLDSPTKVEIINVVGQGLMFLQVLGAITTAQLNFGTLFTEVMDSGAGVVSMSTAFLGVPCIHHGFDTAVAIFALKIILPLFVMAVTSLMFLLVNCVKKGFVMFDALLNCLGEILIEFYVSITLTVLSPWDCYSHPVTGSSMHERPEILCWEGDHSVLLGLSVCGFLIYTVSSIAITFVATWMHPRCMAKEDIGLLVRCHFLFNRWRPECYWFSTVTITRNCLIGLFPTVVNQKDVAVMLMTFTLVIPMILMAAVAPRRTPAMNALDAQISFTQIIILSVGSMSVYTGDLESEVLSLVALILVILVVVVGGFIVSVKCLQYITNNRSPLSWAFDVFLDHHGGAEASAVRTLSLMIVGMVRKGKFFYDYDVYLRRQGFGNIGVIIDASKLSKNGIVALGNETWCRSWCIGAMCGLTQMHAKLVSAAFAANNTQEDDDDTWGQRLSASSDAMIIKRLAKQVPFHELRPMGIYDKEVPSAMKAVLDCTHLTCAMNVHPVLEEFFTKLYQEIASTHANPMKPSSTVVPKFFSGNEASQPGAGHIVISCDHTDPDGQGVSRLFYRFFQGLLAQGNPKMAPLSKHQFTQDLDLDAPAFAKLVQDGKVHSLICIVTPHTLKSVPQLLRLGFLHEHSPIQFKSYPVVISDVFSHPGVRALDGVEAGIGLNLGSDPTGTSKRYTTGVVSLKSVKLALNVVLESSICLCNFPQATVPQITRCLKDLLEHIADDLKEPGVERTPPGPQKVDYTGLLQVRTEPVEEEQSV